MDVDLTYAPLRAPLEALSYRGKAVLFGVCGFALSPLLREVEERFAHRWDFPDVAEALEVSRDFALGGLPAVGVSGLQDRLMAAIPGGHDLDSPWSTYALDVSIAADASLIASTAGSLGEVKSSWLEYMLEPLIMALVPGGYDVPNELLAEGERLKLAIDFLGSTIAGLRIDDNITDVEYQQLIDMARVLNPHEQWP